jgi:multiple sugar transport system substrate-binding protein
MKTTIQVIQPLLAVAILLVAGGACGDTDEPDGLIVWTFEDTVDRVKTQKQILAGFTEKTGVEVRLVGVSENEFDERLTSAVAADDLPDVVAAVSLAAVRTLQANKLLDTETPGAIVDSLSRDTFTPAALDLVSDGGTLLAVPSDAWRLLLVYRKDLFDKAGLPTPNTYQNIARAAAELDKGGRGGRGGRVGFVAGTDPGDVYTQQSFEFFALANGCELADRGGVSLDSLACAEAFGAYADLIREHSVAGNQTFETARANYFAGNAAMILWSSFLLDEMAGLRNDVLPACPECQGDPAFLAKNSGVVTSLTGPSGHQPASFGEVVSWVVTAGAATDDARQLIEHMMSDGYERWLAMAPEGKLPTRAGTKADPQCYARAWARLDAGVDTKAPLSQFYDQSILDAVAASPGAFDRWGFRQGQGELVGAILGQAPVAKSLNKLITSGGDPSAAAHEADQAVETIKQEMGS